VMTHIDVMRDIWYILMLTGIPIHSIIFVCSLYDVLLFIHSVLVVIPSHSICSFILCYCDSVSLITLMYLMTLYLFTVMIPFDDTSDDDTFVLHIMLLWCDILSVALMMMGFILWWHPWSLWRDITSDILMTILASISDICSAIRDGISWYSFRVTLLTLFDWCSDYTFFWSLFLTLTVVQWHSDIWSWYFYSCCYLYSVIFDDCCWHCYYSLFLPVDDIGIVDWFAVFIHSFCDHLQSLHFITHSLCWFFISWLWRCIVRAMTFYDVYILHYSCWWSAWFIRWLCCDWSVCWCSVIFIDRLHSIVVDSDVIPVHSDIDDDLCVLLLLLFEMLFGDSILPYHTLELFLLRAHTYSFMIVTFWPTLVFIDTLYCYILHCCIDDGILMVFILFHCSLWWCACFMRWRWQVLMILCNLINT